METVWSLPKTLKHTWLTTSGITGLTLPGIIEEPAWRGGKLISPRPARGPEDRRRKSLHIFDSFIAVRLIVECSMTYAPQSEVRSEEHTSELQSRFDLV